MLESVPFNIFTRTSDNPDDNGVTCGFVFDVTTLRNEKDDYISRLENQLTNELKRFFLPGSKFKLIKRKDENVYDVLLIDDPNRIFWPVIGEAKEEKEGEKYFFNGDFFKKISEYRDQKNEEYEVIDEDDEKKKNLIYLKQLSAIQENAIFYNLPDVSEKPTFDANVVKENNISKPMMEAGENKTASYFCQQLDVFVKDNKFVSLLLSKEVEKKVGTQDRPFGLPSLFDADIFGSDAVIMHEALKLLKNKEFTLEKLEDEVDKYSKECKNAFEQFEQERYSVLKKKRDVMATAFFLLNVQHYFNLHNKLRRLCVDFVNDKCSELDFKEKVAKCLNISEGDKLVLKGMFSSTGLLSSTGKLKKLYDVRKHGLKLSFLSLNNQAAILLNELLRSFARKNKDSQLLTFNSFWLPNALIPLYNAFFGKMKKRYCSEEKSNKDTKDFYNYRRTTLEEEMLKTDIYEYELKRMLYFDMYNIIVNAFDKTTGKLKDDYDLLKKLQGCFDKYGVRIDGNHQIYAKILLNNFLKNVLSGKRETLKIGSAPFWSVIKGLDNLNVMPLCIGDQVDILNIISSNLSTTIDAQAKIIDPSIADPKKKIIKATIPKVENPEKKKLEEKKPEEKGGEDGPVINIIKKKKKSLENNVFIVNQSDKTKKESNVFAPGPAPGGVPKTEDTFGGSANKFVRIGGKDSNIFCFNSLTAKHFDFNHISSLEDGEYIVIAGNSSCDLNGAGMMPAVQQLVRKVTKFDKNVNEEFYLCYSGSVSDEKLLPVRTQMVKYSKPGDAGKAMHAVYCVGVGNVDGKAPGKKNKDEKKKVFLEFITKQAMLADMLVDLVVKNNSEEGNNKVKKLCINGIGNDSWAPENMLNTWPADSHIADDILGHVLRVKANNLKGADISLFVAGPLANVVANGASKNINQELLKAYGFDDDDAAKNLYQELLNAKTPEEITNFLAKHHCEQRDLPVSSVEKEYDVSNSGLRKTLYNDVPSDNKGGGSEKSAFPAETEKKTTKEEEEKPLNGSDMHAPGELGKKIDSSLEDDNLDNDNNGGQSEDGYGDNFKEDIKKPMSSEKGGGGLSSTEQENNIIKAEDNPAGTKNDLSKANNSASNSDTFFKGSTIPKIGSGGNRDWMNFRKTPPPRNNNTNDLGPKTSNNPSGKQIGAGGARVSFYSGNSLFYGANAKASAGKYNSVISQNLQTLSSQSSVSLKSGITSTQNATNTLQSYNSSSNINKSGQGTISMNVNQNNPNVSEPDSDNNNNQKTNVKKNDDNTMIATGLGVAGATGLVVEGLAIGNVIPGVPLAGKIIIGLATGVCIVGAIYFGFSSPDKPNNGVPKNNLDSGQPQIAK